MHHQHTACLVKDQVQVHGEMFDPIPAATLNDPSMNPISTTRRMTMILVAYLLALVVGNLPIMLDHRDLEQGLDRTTPAAEVGARLILLIEANFSARQPNWTLNQQRDLSSRFGKRWLVPSKQLHWTVPIHQTLWIVMVRGQA